MSDSDIDRFKQQLEMAKMGDADALSKLTGLAGALFGVRTEVVDGVTYAVDRRRVETQLDGTRVLRDPVTGKAWRTNGEQLPDDWAFTDDWED